MTLDEVIQLLADAEGQANSLDFIAENAIGTLSESQQAALFAGAAYIRQLCQLVRRMEI